MEGGGVIRGREQNNSFFGEDVLVEGGGVIRGRVDDFEIYRSKDGGEGGGKYQLQERETTYTAPTHTHIVVCHIYTHLHLLDPC